MAEGTTVCDIVIDHLAAAQQITPFDSTQQCTARMQDNGVTASGMDNTADEGVDHFCLNLILFFPLAESVLETESLGGIPVKEPPDNTAPRLICQIQPQPPPPTSTPKLLELCAV